MLLNENGIRKNLIEICKENIFKITSYVYTLFAVGSRIRFTESNKIISYTFLNMRPFHELFSNKK